MCILYIVDAIIYLIFFIDLLLIKPELPVVFLMFFIFTWLVSLISIGFGIIGLIQKRKIRLCKVHTIGEYYAYIKGNKDLPGDYHIFIYHVNGEEIRARVADEFTEGIKAGMVGDNYDLWFNPKKPKEFIVSPDGRLSSLNSDYLKEGKRGLIVNVICTVVIVVFFLRLIL